ncbi:flavodoxin family protein [Olivibacter sp. CPCC 100613]|uniref:flavodoxin family protein n=1 Tax=Olivibacter sp. CPCC 100613 TaxID=3079931 RepID=UPI002FF6BA5B
MKAIILLTTLKSTGVSNTETLVEFFTPYLEAQEVDVEVIKTIDYTIIPGTYIHMDRDDDWPSIYEKLTVADIIIFATPIWWGNFSSETQKVIERLDEVNDIIMSGTPSPLANKAVGIIITGDSDGSQHIIGSLSNFVNGLGMFVPPFSSLSVQNEAHAKKADTPKTTLLNIYQKEYGDTAQTMASQLALFTKRNK